MSRRLAAAEGGSSWSHEASCSSRIDQLVHRQLGLLNQLQHRQQELPLFDQELFQGPTIASTSDFVNSPHRWCLLL